ncbi:MAG: prepilin-type N-terminal cleavage/methylation domain-containing protein [Candidatus Omnitrophica bacterium]|nr:prepilin-type N-terminal cleavage/methylation domain-containing protein [Candidatus Omnitrophota bacterium]
MKGKRGFTLVEVLVSTALLMGITTVIISVSIGCQRSFITGVELLNLQAQSRQAMQWLRRDIKWAVSLENSRTIGAKTYTTSNSEVVLRLPAISAAGDMITGYDYIVYHLNDSDNSILERVVAADSSSARTSGIYIVARDIMFLVFSSGGTGLSFVGTLSSVANVGISLSAGSQVLGGRNLLFVATTGITLRNLEY